MNEQVTFWTLFKESAIIKGALTLLVWGAIIYMMIVGNEVPAQLFDAGYALIGFWFGTGLAASQAAIAKSKG
jgi:hypothetical protein